MAASLTQSEKHRPKLQFSLGGMMFTFLFGVSIGLAYWRWNEVSFSGAMLLSFSIWLLMGLIQRIQGDLSRLDQFRDAPRQARWGLVIQAFIPIWSIFLLGIVAASEIGWRYGALASGWWPRWLADILFYLAIISAYWEPPLDRSSEPWRTRFTRAFGAAILLVLGVWWGAKIIVSEAQIFRMVYRVIRKVEAAQPTTWADRPFSPTPLTVSSDLLGQVLLVNCR